MDCESRPVTHQYLASRMLIFTFFCSVSVSLFISSALLSAISFRLEDILDCPSQIQHRHHTESVAKLGTWVASSFLFSFFLSHRLDPHRPAPTRVRIHSLNTISFVCLAYRRAPRTHGRLGGSAERRARQCGNCAASHSRARTNSPRQLRLAPFPVSSFFVLFLFWFKHFLSMCTCNSRLDSFACVLFRATRSIRTAKLAIHTYPARRISRREYQLACAVAHDFGDASAGWSRRTAIVHDSWLVQCGQRLAKTRIEGNFVDDKKKFVSTRRALVSGFRGQ